MTEQNERLENLLIEDEMKGSYLSYAMSVIVSRALPDVRDGLKPSQRRVLVAMNDLGLGPRAKYRKCAKIAGDTSGNYHPHGEAVVYPTLVRMAQDFAMRSPLIQGQGNFGSVDGDPPAAMRYTEARMTQAAADMLDDLEKDTVDFVPNYDGAREEPTILPSRFPNLLCNGSNGIAVGMATSIPPHNLGEICDAIRRVLDEPGVTIPQLMEIVHGPDFPTGALICGRKGIHDAYTTGRGQITLRAKTAIEEDKKGRKSIVVTEIPYQLNKTQLIETIADHVKAGDIPAVSDIRDESDRDGMRVVIELKKGEDEHVTLNQLFKFSQLESTFSIINIALVDNRPRTLTLKDLIESYIKHRRDVIRRRTRFLLAKAEARLHIVEGLRIAVDHIDEVVRTIRAAKDIDTARAQLMEKFQLSEIQAIEILRMQLQRLTGLERDKLEEERKNLIVEIDNYRKILADQRLVDDLIRGDLDDMKSSHKSPRRTQIVAPIDAIEDEDLIPDETMAVTVSHAGYVKRLPLDTYRRQGRGGVGITGGDSKDEDFLEHLFVAQNHDFILAFTDRGKVHWVKVHQIPQLSRQSKGRSFANLLRLDEGEKVTSMIPVRDFTRGYLFMATGSGMVKMTPLVAFSRPKMGGIIALGLKEGDALVGVTVVGQNDEVMLGTKSGLAIRFPTTKLRPMGRTARGVWGIRPEGDDQVIGLVVVDTTAHVLTVGANGLGKRTEFGEYRITNRGGKGIINMKVTERTGEVVAIKAVREGDDLMMMTKDGMVVRIAIGGISVIGRNAQGVKLISVREGDRLVAVAPTVKDDTEGEAPRALTDEPVVTELPPEGDDAADEADDDTEDEPKE
ncbi:MAG: DNA gyrase subunit A [Planctomycetes bacterium]|nr:DNA gyrase subunit A [Planctomycetota bacterium]